MKLVHWLFVVSTLLFVCGIGFVIAGARSARDARPVEGPTLTPVASIKQIMKGIVGPSATTVFNSVGTIVSAKGIEEHQPQTDEEWEAVGSAAAALIESRNLLMLGTRAVDKGDWAKMAQALADAATVSLKAVQDRNPQKLLESGEAVNTSCDACHRKYQRG